MIQSTVLGALTVCSRVEAVYVPCDGNLALRKYAGFSATDAVHLFWRAQRHSGALYRTLFECIN